MGSVRCQHQIEMIIDCFFFFQECFRVDTDEKPMRGMAQVMQETPTQISSSPDESLGKGLLLCCTSCTTLSPSRWLLYTKDIHALKGVFEEHDEICDPSHKFIRSFWRLTPIDVDFSCVMCTMK